MKIPGWMVLAALVATGIGCGETEDLAPCEAARDHLQSCMPDEDARIPETCSDAMANDILAQSCDELQANADASAGAADGFCNPFFWWSCGSSGSTSQEPSSEGVSFKLGINVCQSELCVEDLFGEITHGAECGKITLEDASGNIVAVDYVNDKLTWGGVQDTGTGFKDLELEDGAYAARLWRRDGEAASDVEGMPATIDVEVVDGEVSLSSRNFRILADEADAVRACSDIQGTLESTCGGESMSSEDTEWGWAIRIEGVNGEGTYTNLKRSRFVYSLQNHSYLFPRVRAGEYQVTFIELDIWSSWVRDDNRNATYEDYQELVDRYATGREITQELVVTEAEVASSEYVSLAHSELVSETCD